MRFVTQHSIICIWSDYAFSGRCRWLGQLVSRNTSSTKGAKPSASDLKLDSLHNDFGSSTCMSWQTCRVFIVINPPKPVYTRLNGTLPKSGQRPIGSESATQGSRTTHSCVLSFQYVDDCKYAIHLVNGAVRCQTSRMDSNFSLELFHRKNQKFHSFRPYIYSGKYRRKIH